MARRMGLAAEPPIERAVSDARQEAERSLGGLRRGSSLERGWSHVAGSGRGVRDPRGGPGGPRGLIPGAPRGGERCSAQALPPDHLVGCPVTPVGAGVLALRQGETAAWALALHHSPSPSGRVRPAGADDLSGQPDWKMARRAR